ncbi:hypothetical protein FMEXI_6550 [Fusarium mexicanum]|uniref:Uncharacterized protein n=1 Tax=Fusarium mexicanum TaxID=751941 RepID=A0A8H5IY54_9HYPO|nr:hypothetical protein FMEXI_6550 [Fusarium mexicanum]
MNPDKRKMSAKERLLWGAFERAKPRMCAQAAKLTIDAMELHRRYQDRTSPYSHPFYAEIRGRGREDDPELFYYPYMLVLQALWPDNSHVRTMAEAFAKHWGVSNMSRGPEYYPVLGDRELEMELFMGKKVRQTKERVTRVSAEKDKDKDKDKEREEGQDKEEDKQDREQENQQGEEQERDQLLEGEQNKDDGEQEEQQKGGNEDITRDAPDIDSMTDIKKLDELEATLDKKEKDLMAQVHETKQLARKVQERKRDYYKKLSDAARKAAEAVQEKADARRKFSEFYAEIEREYTEKLERSEVTSSTISPLPEQESASPAKQRRIEGAGE